MTRTHTHTHRTVFYIGKSKFLSKASFPRTTAYTHKFNKNIIKIYKN